MNKIIITIIILSTLVLANWQTNLKLNHIKLSDAYVEMIKAQEKARILCREQILISQTYKDNMKDTEIEKQVLSEYLRLVKTYCSEVAGCNCRMEK